MNQITSLRVGEALLFAPDARLDISEGESQPLRMGYRKFRIRRRITADGGKSRMAQ